jgi:uncharacterized protein
LWRYDEEKLKKVVHIIENVSFKNELAKDKTKDPVSLSIEAAIVQDADRLDGMLYWYALTPLNHFPAAIGAVGIARAFSFGGARSRTLYDPR